MSTFMACAAADLEPGADPRQLLEAIAEASRQQPLAQHATQPAAAWIRSTDEGARVSLLADSGNTWLAEALAIAAARVPGLRRAILALDHDEYGAEHIILAGSGEGLRRLQHVYVYPDGEPDDEFEPTLTDVAVPDGLDVAPDGTVNGPASWSAVAALYGVPLEPVERAGRYAEVAHEELGTIFTPFEPWWEAVHARYPFELGQPDLALGPA
ncbi:hypothetical protein AB0M46_37700 [Dactylosporangium sp. NPDC051485]|uniref:hypothetical protein n=1 Tax=Dactylosporangium sp. NPDC051485 TaxID=3154846 RepID=UPI00343DD56D